MGSKHLGSVWTEPPAPVCPYCGHALSVLHSEGNWTVRCSWNRWHWLGPAEKDRRSAVLAAREQRLQEIKNEEIRRLVKAL